MQAWLETASGVRIALQGVCSIGRSSKNTLVLENPEVSRRHALIHAQGREHWLVDLGSSNGIQLNNRRVRQPLRLRDQDRLEIVGNAFVFREETGPGQSCETANTTLATLKESVTAPLWLLVADIEGSTRLCQNLPVEELSQLIGKWFLAGKETLEKFDGTIKDYTGDGYFAYWPKSGQLAHCVAQTIAELKILQQNPSPPFRLAVHYGTVTVDKEVSEGQESLLGPEVNFLFRMEKLAASLQRKCLLSAPAAHHLRAFGEAVSVGAHTVAGFDRPHEFFAY